MRTLWDIVGVFGVVAAVGGIAYLCIYVLDRLFGLTSTSRPRYPTPLLEVARRWMPNVRAVIWLAAIVVVTGYVLSRRPTDVAMLIALPLALGLGLSLRDYFANALAGLVLSVTRPFKAGDRIELEDIVGQVVSVGLSHTQLTTQGGREMRVPNRTLITREYRISRTGYRDLAVEVSLMIPDGVGLPKAKKCAYTSAIVSRYASPRRRPEVFVETNDAEVRLRVRAYACDPSQLDAYKSDLTEIWLEAVTAGG